MHVQQVQLITSCLVLWLQVKYSNATGSKDGTDYVKISTQPPGAAKTKAGRTTSHELGTIPLAPVGEGENGTTHPESYQISVVDHENIEIVIDPPPEDRENTQL